MVDTPKAFRCAIFVITRCCWRFKSSGLSSLTMKIRLVWNVGNYQSNEVQTNHKWRFYFNYATKKKVTSKDYCYRQTALIYATLVLTKTTLHVQTHKARPNCKLRSSQTRCVFMNSHVSIQWDKIFLYTSVIFWTFLDFLFILPDGSDAGRSQTCQLK